MLARILVLLAQVTILLSAELAEAQLVLCPGLDGFGGAYYHSQVPFVTVVTVSVGVGYRHTVYPETLQSLNFTMLLPVNKTDHMQQGLNGLAFRLLLVREMTTTIVIQRETSQVL